MRAKYLRIGNYCQDQTTGALLKVDSLTDMSFGFYVVDRSKYPLPKNWKAGYIPISEDWLIKFGFKRKPEDDSEFFVKDTFSGCFYDEWGDFELTDYEKAPCRCIHELQNLFYAITGKELTI